jgi:DNA repair protein RadC
LATLSSSKLHRVIDKIFLFRRRFSAHATFDIVRRIHPTVRSLSEVALPVAGTEDEAWLQRKELNPTTIIDVLEAAGLAADRGRVIALFVDNRCGLIRLSSVGTVDDFSSRRLIDEILRIAIDCHAAGIILATNDPTKSIVRQKRSRDFTKRLYGKAEAIGLCLLDHVVLTAQGWRQMSGLKQRI